MKVANEIAKEEGDCKFTKGGGSYLSINGAVEVLRCQHARNGCKAGARITETTFPLHKFPKKYNVDTRGEHSDHAERRVRGLNEEHEAIAIDHMGIFIYMFMVVDVRLALVVTFFLNFHLYRPT